MPLPRLLPIALAGVLLTLVATGCNLNLTGSAVTVSFTSHTDGERIVGLRSVTVTGELRGATPSAFELTLNGKAVSVPLPTAGTFSATVTLADGTNTVVAAATASGQTSTATLHLVYPYLTLTDGQAATVAIGQTSFTSSLPDTTQNRLDAPAGAPALVGSRLYLPDTANNRTVGLDSVPTTNGAFFDVLLGHDLYTDGTAAIISASALATPAGVADAGGDLMVADTGNNRVLLYSGAPTITNTTASVEVGQAGMFSNSDTTCTAARLEGPRAAVVAGGQLVVADTGHNRILIWNSVPTSNGTAADLVLGQQTLPTSADPQSCQANRGLSAPTASTLSTPSGVWSDGTRLVVADTGNNRVLIWTTFPTGDGQAANLVLGQAGMTTAGAGPGNGGLNAPRSVSSNGNQLFVADSGNHRVLLWGPFPTANHAPATNVLGQTGFTLSDVSANRGGPADATTLSDPEGVRVFDGMLMVADTGNNRELIFQP